MVPKEKGLKKNNRTIGGILWYGLQLGPTLLSASCLDGLGFINLEKRRLVWVFFTYAHLDCFVSDGLLTASGERIQGNRPMQISADAPLPVVPSNVMLANGEVCHYCGPATFVKTKNVVVGYSGGSRGTSVRIAKGMSVHLGARKAAPIRGDVQERTQGVLSITNKRVVFSANKGAFDKKISALSAVTPYQNGIAFQFGDQQYPLETRQPEYIYQILARVVNSSEDI